MSQIYIREPDGSVIFEVRVIPRASRTEIVGQYNGALKMKLTAPPVEGAANAELIKHLAKKFDVPKRNIDIVSGQTSRSKRIRVRGAEIAKIDAVLKPKS